MIAVQVTYSVKPDFVAINKKLIANFLVDFKLLKHLSFMYNVFTKEDGVSFVHTALYDTQAIQENVMAVPSFVAFQAQRDAEGLVGEVKIENLEMIGSSLYVISKPASM